MLAIFEHVFAMFTYLIGPLVAKSLHILVEEVLRFGLSGVESKLVNNCLQK